MIEINNLTTILIKKAFLIKISQMVLEGEKKKNSELSIALVGEGRIKALNKKYRGKNKVTDVLSFSSGDVQNLGDEALPHLPTSPIFRSACVGDEDLPHLPTSPIFRSACVGEVIICLREVKKNAKKYKSTFEKELVRILIHGLLHLLGYNHEKSEVEAKKMEDKQNYYISKVYWRRPGLRKLSGVKPRSGI